MARNSVFVLSYSIGRPILLSRVILPGLFGAGANQWAGFSFIYIVADPSSWYTTCSI